MGSHTSLVPSVQRIIAQAPGYFRAGGPTPMPVGFVLPPVRPPFRGDIGPATEGAVIVLDGTTVATTSCRGGAPRGASLRSWLVISLRGTVGPAVSRTVVAAGTIIIPAPVAPCVSPFQGRGIVGGRVPRVVSAPRRALQDGDHPSDRPRAAAMLGAPVPSR